MTFRKRKYSYLLKIFIIRILILASISTANGQNNDASKMDTLRLKEGSTLIINRQKIKINTDTVIIIPTNIQYNVKLGKDERFYNSLERKTRNNFWTRELHNIIISDSHINNVESLKTIPSTQTYNAYQKKYIRHIIIKQLQVFGPTITDTLAQARSFIEKTGNKLHIQTKKYLIQKNLLFKESDLVNPNVLADNERVLRNLPYIDDSKIEIKSLGALTDSVDILVIVKDIWSMGFDLRMDNLTTGRLDIMNKNILGWGQETQNSALWDKRKKPGTGYEGIYVIHNIGGSFFKGKLLYNKSFGDQTITLTLNRDFFTPNIKYAGGFSFKNIKSDYRYFSANPSEFYPIEYNEVENWIGRSFLLSNKNTNSNRQNLTFAGKVIFDKFYQRPKVTETSYYELYNKTLFLFSAIYTHQNFYKSNHIYNFGRTEDIPVGVEASLTTGYEINEFHNRKYISGKFASGYFLDHYGYLSSGLSLGSFFNENKPEQGILTANLNYFSNLYILNRFSFRQFLNIDLTKGINRFFREYITMNDKLGIAGYTNDSIYGNQRFHLKWETVCFTPWKFYGFKFVLFITADHTWLGKQNQKIFYGAPYSGFGFGVRLRNERLVFNTIQLKFSFYPNIPSGSSTNFLKLSGESILSPPDFSPKAPKLTEFN